MATRAALPRGTVRRRRRDEGWDLQLEADFTQGIIRDAAHQAIPPGGVRDSVDYLLHEPGRAIKRGGTVYVGPAMSGASYAAMVAYAPFTAGAKLIAISESGHAHLYTVTPGTTTDVSTLGSGFPPKSPPAFFASATTELVVIPASDGSTAPKKYDGSSVAALGGSPPAGLHVVSYKNRLWIANADTNPNRVWGSLLGDAQIWDTAAGWIDFEDPVTCLAALPNAILVGSNKQVWRLVGTAPPPGSDMEQQPVSLLHGIPDARGVTVWQGQAIYCNPQGAFMTPGSGLTNLTRKGGYESYWQSLFSGYDPSTWTLSCGVYRGHLHVCILDNNGALVDFLMCDLERFSWTRHSNIRAVAFAHPIATFDDLWYADRNAARVTSVGTVWYPTSATKNDADGDAVAPVIQLRPFFPSPGVTHYWDGWVSYDMRDAASDNPTLAVAVATGLEAESFAAVSESPLAETTIETRRTITIAKESQALSVKLTQSGASSQTEIYGVQVRGRPQAAVFGGQ